MKYLASVVIVIGSVSSWSQTLRFQSAGQQVEVRPIVQGLKTVWGFDFLPVEKGASRKLILTEKTGQIKILNLESRVLQAVSGVPKVNSRGQGGLMDIAVHPKFSSNRWVFLTYSVRFWEGTGTVVARAELVGAQLKNLKVLFRARPPGTTGRHFGSRLVFGPQRTLFFGIGDRGERAKAQDLSQPHGKLFRIYEDGRVPPDNPFVGDKKAIGAIWSYGHRNPQGMAIHPQTGALWEQEHGPRGGDEINLIRRGANYGWPVITYGKEYWGPRIGTTHKKGMEQPVKFFVPSIAPASLMIYSGKLFKGWKGHFFSGALKLQHLNRVVIKDGQAVSEERLLKKLGERIRHVREAPSGEIYFSTDSGRIFKLSLVAES